MNEQIKRYDVKEFTEVGTGRKVNQDVEAEDGDYVMYEDHLRAIEVLATAGEWQTRGVPRAVAVTPIEEGEVEGWIEDEEALAV